MAISWHRRQRTRSSSDINASIASDTHSLVNRLNCSGLAELRTIGTSSSVAELYLVSQTIAEEEGLHHPLNATRTVPITDPRLTHNNHSNRCVTTLNHSTTSAYLGTASVHAGNRLAVKRGNSGSWDKEANGARVGATNESFWYSLQGTTTGLSG